MFESFAASVFVRPEVYQKELDKAKEHAHGLKEKYERKMVEKEVGWIQRCSGAMYSIELFQNSMFL